MAVITPQTDIYLLKVPIELDNTNQLTFENATAQYNYFSSMFPLEASDYSYQRKDGTIRFEGRFDDLVEYNYVMYRNTAYSNKWFYAYITGMEYVSNDVTAIKIKTDVWQTWMFDLDFKPVLIDREHTNDDTVGANTLPEGLELGEMIVNGNVANFGDGSNYCTVIEVSMIENQGENQTLSYSWASGSHDSTPILNGIDRGTTPLIVGMVQGAGNTASHVINVYDKAGLGDAIINVYMLPKSLVGSYNEISITATSGSETYTATGIVVPETSFSTTSITSRNLTRPTQIDGYTPKNKKLLTYPFCYFNVSNNAGASMPYHYEDFGSTITFNVEGTFGASGETKAIPVGYKKILSSQNALDYSINGGKFPICSWKSDSYTNWLTQNAVNMELQLKSAAMATAIGTIGGAARGAIMGGGVSGAVIGGASGLIENGAGIIHTVLDQHIAKTQANLVPDQVHGNLGAGDFVWAKYNTPFSFIPMSIKSEYARCIDEFFSQFGYKCNRVKIPNITGRRNWNYVKTVGCYVSGNVPQEDIQEIKNMFDRGVTFWHNPLYFGNYGVNNDII